MRVLPPSYDFHQAATRFDAEADAFGLSIRCESARWGDTVKTPAYARSDWLTNKSARSSWLEARRAHILTQLQTFVGN